MDTKQKMNTIFRILKDLNVNKTQKDIIAEMLKGAFDGGFRAALNDCAGIADEAAQTETAAQSETYGYVMGK